MKSGIVVVVGIVALLAGMSIGASLLAVAPPTVGSVKVYDYGGGDNGAVDGYRQFGGTTGEYIPVTGTFTVTQAHEPTGVSARLSGATSNYVAVTLVYQLYKNAGTLQQQKVLEASVSLSVKADAWFFYTFNAGFTGDNEDYAPGVPYRINLFATGGDLRIAKHNLPSGYNTHAYVWGEPPPPPAGTQPGTPSGTPSQEAVGAVPSEATDAGAEVCEPGFVFEDGSCRRPADVGNLLLWAVVAILVLFGVAALFMAIWR